MVTRDPSLLLIVDVEKLHVEVPAQGWHRTFVLDPMTRERLLNGWDDIGLTLRHVADIDRYEAVTTAPTLAGRFDRDGHIVA